MYCSLKQLHKVALKGGELLGQGSYGSIKRLSDLPQPQKFEAKILDLHSSKTTSSVKEVNQVLNISQYEEFIKVNQEVLVAKHFTDEADFKQEAEAVMLMFSKIEPRVIDDCTIMHAFDKDTTHIKFRFMIDVFGKKFLLYKKMEGDLSKSLLTTEQENNILFYRTALTVYAFLYKSLSSQCFHRDIKPANLLYKKTSLGNGQVDFDVRVGDFGLFTDKIHEFLGTPLFMCIFDEKDMVNNLCTRFDAERFRQQNKTSVYKWGTFVNETYGYNATLFMLLTTLQINNEELKAYVKQYLGISINQAKNMEAMRGGINYAETFVTMAVYPKAIMAAMLKTNPKKNVFKKNNPSVPIYHNSFIANIALHEIDKYLRENQKSGIIVNDIVDFSRPNGPKGPYDVNIGIKTPHIFTYLYAYYLEGIPRVSATIKDMADFMHYYYVR
jgi:hypothetical protein